MMHLRFMEIQIRKGYHMKIKKFQYTINLRYQISDKLQSPFKPVLGLSCQSNEIDLYFDGELLRYFSLHLLQRGNLSKL